MTNTALKMLLVAAVCAGSAGAGVAQGRGNGSVPPGLAGKPGQMPPGQYKKLRGSADHDRDRDREREHAYRDRWVYLDDVDRYRLPPLPAGQAYVRVDDRILRVIRDTAVVIEAMGIVSNLLR